jgi:hypothetical protein
MPLDFITQAEKDLLTEDFSDMVSDADMTVTIIYQRSTGQGTFDPTTGTRTPTFDDFETVSFRQPIASDEFAVEGYEIGDVRYLMRRSDFEPTQIPATEDRIVEGGETRFVVEVREDPIGIFYSIVARDIGTT